VRFADTNILLYAVSTAPDEQDKAARANELLDAGDIAVSLQVLQEFYVQATRPSRSDRLTHAQAAALVESFLRFPAAEITTRMMRAAFELHDQARISYWDAAIIEAARSLGCEIVLSEDLSDGQDYAGVRVHNPFAP
jgi:predicted nucleic acid-binding protein